MSCAIDVHRWINRSRTGRSAGGGSGEGSRRRNAAAIRASVEGKLRYSVVRATPDNRVTASTVTAAAPPETSRSAAASSSLPRDRARRGSVEEAMPPLWPDAATGSCVTVT